MFLEQTYWCSEVTLAGSDSGINPDDARGNIWGAGNGAHVKQAHPSLCCHSSHLPQTLWIELAWPAVTLASSLTISGFLFPCDLNALDRNFCEELRGILNLVPHLQEQLSLSPHCNAITILFGE